MAVGTHLHLDVRGKVIVLDLTVQERQGCHSLMPQVQPVTRLELCSLPLHTGRAHTYAPHACTYTACSTDQTDTQHSREPRQHQQADPAPFSGWAGWRSATETVQCTSLQQLSSSYGLTLRDTCPRCPLGHVTYLPGGPAWPLWVPTHLHSSIFCSCWYHGCVGLWSWVPPSLVQIPLTPVSPVAGTQALHPDIPVWLQVHKPSFTLLVGIVGTWASVTRGPTPVFVTNIYSLWSLFSCWHTDIRAFQAVVVVFPVVAVTHTCTHIQSLTQEKS